MNNEDLKNFSQDLLGRKQIASNLTNIIKKNQNLSVLAIDSGWGTGKTTFINMWRDMIINDKDSEGELIYNNDFETMYFNAWENDYISEPLVSLLCELNTQIKTKDGKVKTFFDSAMNKGKTYGKIGAQIGLRYLTKGVLNSVDWNKNLEDGLQDLSNKIGEAVIKNVSSAKNARKELKEQLKEFQEKIGKKVIVFIDELDRCRPTFAIELLETIKHIFNLDNYIFVISLDKEQLSHSIKTLYGQGMNATGYLRRFFDLEYVLPLSGDLKNYIKIQNETIGDYSNIGYFKRFIEEIFFQENYSLRDVNKAINYIKVFLPNIIEFQDEKAGNYYDQYLIIISYIYAYFINLKIKHDDILKTIMDFNYKANIEYIKNNIININKDEMNLKFNEFGETRIKALLENLLEKFIMLLYDANVYGLTSRFFNREYTKDRYRVGIKKEDGTYFENSEFNLYDYYNNLSILEKINFLKDFNF